MPILLFLFPYSFCIFGKRGTSCNAKKTFWIFSPQVDWMLTLETDPTGSRMSAFECGLKTSRSGRHHLVDLHEFDMVFVPVLEVDHYYLIVFDLEDERIYLVDHLGDRGSGVLLRDNETYILKTTPFKVSVNHPKATAMQSSVIMREDLPWSTTQRNAAPFVDSDIFAMCHMEQFVGSRRNFFCGFSVHGARKKAQCNYLRKRYAAEILLSPRTNRATRYDVGWHLCRQCSGMTDVFFWLGVFGLGVFWGRFARLDNDFYWDVDIYVGMRVSWTNTSWLCKTLVGEGSRFTR
ncbi:putative papain-like cysteine peptidase superfamily [Helianthus annuus]|nr:putative papain-like cysteine peptidase superfamily [Helianthus annuus]